MHPYPHQYSATSVGEPTGNVTVSSPGLPDQAVDSPVEFDGPGDLWSPETLLMSSLANCLALTWRSVAAHNGYAWHDVRVDVTGVLDRVERVARFTEVQVTLHLTVPADADADLADRLAHKTERACLVSNSLNAAKTLEVRLTRV